MIKYSKELVKEIIDKFNQGSSSKDISVLYSIDIKSIYYILSKNGVKPDKRKKISDDLFLEIEKRYKNGEKVNFLAKEFKVNYQLIYDYFKRNNIEPCQRKLFSRKEEEIVISDYKDGVWVKVIASKFNVHKTVIYDCLHKNNIEIRMDGNRFTEVDVDNIVEKYKNGISVTNLAKEYETNTGVICSFLKKKDIKRRSRYKYTCNHDFFNNINSEEQSYWLGFFVGDGHLSPENAIIFGLSAIDDNHLRLFLNHINADHKLTYRMKSGKPSVNLFLTSKKMGKSLRDMGYDNNKSHTAKPPSEKFLSNDLAKHFWRGCVDADGCLSFSRVKGRNKHFSICLSGTESICDGFLKYLKVNNVVDETSKTKPNKHNGIFHLRFSHRLARKIADHLYANTKVFLERKNKKYQYMRELFPIEKDYL